MNTHYDIENLRKTVELLSVKNVCSLYAVEKTWHKMRLKDSLQEK